MDFSNDAIWIRLKNPSVSAEEQLASLPDQSYCKKFIFGYDYWNDDCGDSATFLLDVLSLFLGISSSDDLLKKPTSTDWVFFSYWLLDGVVEVSPSVLAIIVQSSIEEVEASKGALSTLGIHGAAKARRGRPSNKRKTLQIIQKVALLKASGNYPTLSKIYEQVGFEWNLSPGTVRRYWEKHRKSGYFGR